MVASPSAGAISCSPTGSPSDRPAGTETAALPARLTGMVNTSLRYMASGSSAFSPTGKATVGAVGPTSRSKRS